MSEHRHIKLSEVGDVTIIRFNDHKIINAASISEMGDELFSLVSQDHRQSLLLNFSNVEFLSSGALNKLIVLDQMVKEANGKLHFCSLKPEIIEVIKLTRLNRVFSIHDDQETALSSF